jgi:thiosulfate/3-mercaptopyruvate sulfurtransferase
MAYTTLISVGELTAHLYDPDWAIIDCRFTLGDTERGVQDYLRGHIPGALYAHLDNDLCAPIVAGVTGRHPLPSVEEMAAKFAGWGIDENVQVIAYDDWPQIGLAVSARLWWMLRYLGHEKVAVLDGGWVRWVNEGLPIQTVVEPRKQRMFTPDIHPEFIASSEDVDKFRQTADHLVIDARSVDRYRGENETIDPVAGHIPGAISLPYTCNINPEGIFLSQQDLQEMYRDKLGNLPPDRIAFYCGSGVTAAVDVLAMAHAGLGEARLYAGSWSEWITDAARPVE